MKSLFNILTSNKYFYLVVALLSYIIPVSIFGHWTIYTATYFPVSVLLMYSIINWKAIEGKEWVTYLSSALHGLSVSMFGITVFGFTMEGSIIHLSIYWGILVYMISSVPYITSIDIYRKMKKQEYDSSFNDEKSRDRDLKINKILGF